MLKLVHLQGKDGIKSKMNEQIPGHGPNNCKKKEDVCPTICASIPISVCVLTTNPFTKLKFIRNLNPNVLFNKRINSANHLP